jgi:hypothetical protein
VWAASISKVDLIYIGEFFKKNIQSLLQKFNEVMTFFQKPKIP